MASTGAGASAASLVSSEPIRTVVLKRGVTGLDFSIKGGSDFALPVVVSRVFAGGVADRCGAILMGDEILSVNGKSLVGASHADAVLALKQSGAEVTMLLRSNNGLRGSFMPACIDSRSQPVCVDEAPATLICMYAR
jgi:S1-C subfamily serine protease